MRIDFPYADVRPLEIPSTYAVQTFDLPPQAQPSRSEAEIVQHALDHPIGTPRIRDLAKNARRVLLVADDISRPTPVARFVHLVIEELHQAGLRDEQIEFLMALGSHRLMTRDEMVHKLGEDVVNTYTVHNHDWTNPECLEYLGETDQGVPVWINTLVSQADVVIGLGAIMPIEVAGFTGGGKILVPGVCGVVTNSEMHWTRIGIDSAQILGKADNPVRASIDSLARKAGLDAIVNVVLNADSRIVGAVAGDMVAAHRVGCQRASEVFGVPMPQEFDIVIAHSFPFDIEFWQANKALDTAGEVVKPGGVIILVSPCYEGFSPIHAAEILQYGYPPVQEIEELVQSGQIQHKVVGVHMYQVRMAAGDHAKLILVSSGISKDEAEQVGFLWAETAQEAFDMATRLVAASPAIAVLNNASRMLILKEREQTV